MSRTISFRASEELDEFLETEAKRRMTTKSTVANILLAERVVQLKGEQPEVQQSGSEGNGGENELPRALQEHRDKWHRPDSDKGYKFAVKMPAGGRLKYYKTAKYAAQRIIDEYE